SFLAVVAACLFCLGWTAITHPGTASVAYHPASPYSLDSPPKIVQKTFVNSATSGAAPKGPHGPTFQGDDQRSRNTKAQVQAQAQKANPAPQAVKTQAPAAAKP